LIPLLKDEANRAVMFLALSGIALLFSMLRIADAPIDAAWVAILLCGIPIIKGAITALVTKFDIKADVLVSIALVASVAIGEIFAAGEVAFIMAIGAYLEERTVARARAGIEKLARLTPTTARIIIGGEERIVGADTAQPGDTLLVLAGETIAADGVISRGRTSIDQSVMTGESLPVDKGPGDEVKSGTVNQFGTFEMVAQRVGEDSSLRRMIRLVESAGADKAKIVASADRWATWIVFTALAAALATWLATGEVIRSVTVLVVFCPCALVLATPTAIVAGIGNVTKYGILVREGDALERMAAVKMVAFDKTGTLTCGKPEVVEVKSCNADMSTDEILDIAASAELRSEHPLGRAIVSHFRCKRTHSPRAPESFQMLPGRGVKASVGGRGILAGNEALLSEHGIQIPEELSRMSDLEKSRGCTVLYLAEHGSVFGFIALSDTLRPDARDTIAAIHASGLRTLLLTGDAPGAANYMAQSAGISDVRPGCMPEDKIHAIHECEKMGEPVCMIGDGINDAPALKSALVSIAMGGIGSDIAIDAADITLVGDDIKWIPHLLSLSKKVMRTININIATSMILNFAAITLAMTGLLTPVLGALVHNAGSVAVIVNSALLLKWRERNGVTQP
jgi:heavy metal translocating P-type ATPase